MLRALALLALLSPLLSGCASYTAKPLPGQPSDTAGELRVDSASLHFASLRQHRFDPSDGLDMTEVAMLAVCHNPELQLARDDAGISQAQAFAAGLLPDPQVSLGVDFPVSSPGAGTAFSLGLSEDLAALVQHNAIKNAARASQRQTDLNLLWQEWQTITQARLLFLRVQAAEQALPWLEQNHELLQTQATAMQKALNNGTLGLDVVQPVLSAAADAERQRQDALAQARQARFDLNALLGLPATAQLKLVDSPLASVNASTIDAARNDLPQRRPDLIALRAGYEAQEAHLRQAVLAQFPGLSLGINAGRDNTGVKSLGPAVGFSLPLFNRGRGGIAIETATRQRLYDEYQARLNDAYRHVAELQAQQEQAQKRLQALQPQLADLDQRAPAASAAFKAGLLDAGSYASLAGARLSLHQDALAQQEAAAELAVSLEAELGPLPHDTGAQP